jgi:hypothetical protein
MIYYRFLVLLAIVFSLVVPSVTFGLEGFPGSTWGELRLEVPRTGKEDAILQGWIRQGIDLKRWSDQTHLYVYGTVRYTWDSQQNPWWNDVAPGGGIAFDTNLGKQFPVTWGVEYLWDRFFVEPHTEDKVVLYMNWYGWWDFQKK